MVILSHIFLSIWVLTMIVGVISLIIIGGSKKITLFQYLYLRIFAEKKDWCNYVKMNEYIDSGHSIPIMELHDFTYMQCDPSMTEQYIEFISHSPYYFLIFDRSGRPDLCGYRTNITKDGNLIFSAFYQKLCLKMASKMGYTYDDLCSILKDGLAREEDRRIKIDRRIKELADLLKEQQKLLNKKQNNTSI